MAEDWTSPNNVTVHNPDSPSSLHYRLSIVEQTLASAGLTPSAKASVHLPNESPDGIRQTFSFTDLPSDATAFLLVWGGIVQAPGNDFSVSSGVVTMIQVPKANDNLFAFY